MQPTNTNMQIECTSPHTVSHACSPAGVVSDQHRQQQLLTLSVLYEASGCRSRLNSKPVLPLVLPSWSAWAIVTLQPLAQLTQALEWLPLEAGDGLMSM